MQIPRDVVPAISDPNNIASAVTVAPTVQPNQAHTTGNPISKDTVTASVDSVKKHLENMQQTQVELSFDNDLNRVIVKYVDKDNGQVESQIPSEKFVEFAKEFTKTIGLLFDQKV
ncbi:MAG: flagellar protein FlaG [Tumebacillaceae bacterium]